MFAPYLDRWSLISDGEPIITHSSRLLPVLWQDRPAMLKVTANIDERYGALLMQWWDGDGAAYVYAHEGDAVLLERATGKRSLLAMAMNGEDDKASRILCGTAARLHAPREKPLPDPIPLTRWFRDLEPAASKHGGTLADCSAIANVLLADQRDVTILHGDIHHDNILDFEARGWLAIDPKRLHGERGFDFANIFANEELPVITDPVRFRRQLAIVSAEAGLEPKRLLQWIAAYSGLSAAWFLGDPNIQQAETALTVARIALAELES
ncbi:aminoglycoside phosphotransferase family protein [Rhizobium beringeri]|jgi:streptomycin 6-kinase|uniref:3'-kinase n=1 Tax=Rhizobium beringeri TaxID=3019934 RepID=A0ABY1XWD6_9HYPH|nr:MULTISPECIES: aminoglycoside phosphotransferase family protein [Rhizobium]RWX11699.1 3'-kinase [Rhizobium leguminosarum]TBC74109.1 3'-kinase [Rhizobium leguminosarum]TBC95341.1 3'-kinase [Rhizobium leguminosarum]TBE71964.1 3'-kinase [Rhizobium beringeri]WSG87839.1 aminoglycoside phosphotransferase family protein [Rhizobium beringeri]